MTYDLLLLLLLRGLYCSPPEGAIEVSEEAPPDAAAESAAPAPEPEPETRSPSLREATRFGVWGGYLGHELTSPGGQVGIEYRLASAEGFDALFAASLYVHDNLAAETGYGLLVALVQRYTAPFGLVLESRIALGAQGTTHDAPVITASGAEAMIRSETRTHAGAALWALLGAGYDFRSLLNAPFMLRAGLGVAWTYPDPNGVFQSAPLWTADIVFWL